VANCQGRANEILLSLSRTFFILFSCLCHGRLPGAAAVPCSGSLASGQSSQLLDGRTPWPKGEGLDRTQPRCVSPPTDRRGSIGRSVDKICAYSAVKA
jgi:hypothetical protein